MDISKLKSLYLSLFIFSWFVNLAGIWAAWFFIKGFSDLNAMTLLAFLIMAWLGKVGVNSRSKRLQVLDLIKNHVGKKPTH